MIGKQVREWTITRQIGEGGMGAVFLAEHSVLKTPHVIKVLLPQWTQNEQIVQRFINEARAAAAINHRNIVRIENCFIHEGQWWIVMEFLDGNTLAKYAESHGGPLSPYLVLEVLAQVANGLEAAHKRGIVHRDLKPENIFLTSRDGNPHFVKILDFGIAKLGEASGGGGTRTGQMAGTPAYMAPEQMRDFKNVDARSDVYALGVIAYQLLTGGWLPYQDGGAPQNYYELSAAEIYHRQLTIPAVDPRRRCQAISEAWANAIMATLNPEPDRRPQTARQLVIMLAESLASDSFSMAGIDIVKAYAKELLDIGNMLETVRAPQGGTGSRQQPSRYHFGQRLGEGGMAEVFRGTMTGAEGFARDVAIKRVLPGFSTTPQFASMFIDEARIASQLAHPNIVPVLDFDRDAEGRLFLVMELVEGKSLDALRDTGPLPPSVIIFVISEALRGLGFAHSLPVPKQGMRGVIHRDVSPHNVLLSWEGAVKVSDFGIAKARDATAATASTMIKGKPGYMSPEQANGEQLDGRSDLFAVGVMLWELLAGQQLFSGTSQEIIAQVFFRTIPKPSTLRAGVPPDLEAVAMRLLEREKNARYATAEAAIADLARCRDVPRDGRGDLVRLLVERFPQALTERLSGQNIGSSQHVASLSTQTAPGRPQQLQPASAWGPPATTLGSAAAQSVVNNPPRRTTTYVVASVLVAGFAVGGILLAKNRGDSPSVPAAGAGSSMVAQPAPPVLSDAPDAYRITITTTPIGAVVVVDGENRGPSPVTLSVGPKAELKISATHEGFENGALSAVADHDGQTLALTLVQLNTQLGSGGSAARAPSTSTAKPTTTGKRTHTSRSGAKATKASTGTDTSGKQEFDPDEVGGD